MAATFEFDYWDCYGELLGVCLILSGEPWWVLAGAVVWGLSRETVWLAPVLRVACCVESGSLVEVSAVLAMMGPAVWLLVRAYQGKAALYSGRWSLRGKRLRAWRAAWARSGGPRSGDLRPSMPMWKYALGLVGICVVNPYSATDLGKAWERKDAGVLLSMVYTLSGVGVALFANGNMPPALARTAWVGLVWLVAGWTLARARETRLFLPVCVWMAGAVSW